MDTGQLSNSFDLAKLKGRIKPFRLRWLAHVGSTNNYAARMRRRGELFAPAMVLTGRQTAGRGRNTNTWWSGSGSLTVTFVLPIDEHVAPHQLPLIAGLAVRNAVAEIAGNDDIQLKWPNDLVYRGRKLAGLLCERVHKADLVGFGLNVNAGDRVPPALARRVVFLSEIARTPLDKTDVLIAVTQRLQPLVSRRNEHFFATLLRQYDRHHALVGRRVTVAGNGGDAAVTGVCQGLDSIGRLLVKSRGVVHRIIAGQVEAY